MTTTSRDIVFISLQTTPRQLSWLAQAAAAVARDDPPLPYTVAPFARRRNGHRDRRVMIAFQTSPSRDAAYRTCRRIVKAVSGDVTIRTTVHYSDGSEVALQEYSTVADPEA